MQKLIELSQDIFKELPSYNSWTNFLATAAWHYKYPFPDQTMIYMQRPDAKACASIGVWNNTLHRWVNKGTKGIALIHNKNGRPYIDYVFNISDTNSFYGNEVKLWEYNEKYNDAIIETLENTFGELSSKHSIVDAVISAAHNAVEDNKADYQSMRKDYSDKISDAVKKIHNLETVQSEAEKKYNYYCDLSDAVEKIVKNNALTKELIGKLIDKIYVYKGRKVEIIYNFENEYESEVATNA